MGTVIDNPLSLPRKSFESDQAAHRANLKGVEDFAQNIYTQLVPVGTIIAYAGTTIPTGWLLCDGQAISRTEYSSLFNIIATVYGAGDGITTFNLPDFTSSSSTDTRVPVGAGSGRVLGSTTGTILSNAITAQGVGVVVNFLIKS